MIEKYKYPRTPHLPFSKGFTKLDRVLINDNQFLNKEVVVTEKLDGENITLYPDGTFHARSLDTGYHESRNWLKRWWNEKVWTIDMPQDYRICGEYMYATHSIFYQNLESYFYLHSIWHGNFCLDYDTTKLLCEKWELTLVPEIYRGLYNRDDLVEKAAWILDYNRRRGQPRMGGQTIYPFNEIEGFVVRRAEGFNIDFFEKNVAKWVRPNHVVGNQHWTQGKFERNMLRNE